MKLTAILMLLPIAAFAAEAAMPLERDVDVAAMDAVLERDVDLAAAEAAMSFPEERDVDTPDRKGKAYQGKCSTKTQRCNGKNKRQNRKCNKASLCRHDKDPCECSTTVCACGH